MDTKAAFEKWWNDSDRDELRMSCSMGWAYFIWTASRATIEIKKEPEHEWMGEYPSHDSFLDGYANGWNDCVDAITSHGIRIKGKTE